MKKLKSILYLRLVFSLSLVLFLNLLMSNHLVNASQISIPNSDVKYETWVQMPGTNHWEQFDNSLDGFIPNQSVNVRLRFYLPSTQSQDVHYNISFTLLHNQASISLLSMNVLDQQGNILGNDNVSWGAVKITNNSTNLRTIVNIEDFTCSTSSWVTLTFVYNTSTSAVSGNPSNGYIQLTCSYFDMQQVSFESALNNFSNNLFSWLDDYQDNQDSNTQSIVSAVEDSNDSLLDSISDLGSLFTTNITNLGLSIGQTFTSVGATINNAIGSAASTVVNGVINGLTNLFIPDSDDLIDWVTDFQQELYDENPLVGNVVSVFTNTIELLSSGTQSDTIHIPSVELEFGDDTFVIGDWDVPLFPEGLSDYIAFVRLITSLIVCLALFNMLLSKILVLVGIKSGQAEDTAQEMFDLLASTDDMYDSYHANKFWSGY